MKSICVLIFLIIGLWIQTWAQQCLITEMGPDYNRVYTSPNVNLLTGGYAMYNSSSSSYSPCGWSPTGITGKSCGVCSFLGLCAVGICACLGTIYTGYEASSFTIIECPIDDLTWPVLLISVAFGLFSIKKNKN